MSATVHRVENARSLLMDHITYHRNPLEVVVPIVSLIDPDRFAADVERLRRLGTRRNRRLWIKRFLDIVIIVAFFFALFGETGRGRLVALALLAGSLTLGWLWSLWHNRRTEFEFLGDSRWFAFKPQRVDASRHA
jgi:hypothetical protein